MSSAQHQHLLGHADRHATARESLTATGRQEGGSDQPDRPGDLTPPTDSPHHGEDGAAGVATVTIRDPFSAALDAAMSPVAYLAAMRRAVVHAATRAPSVHNSQPWLFTQDDDGLDLYADDSRRLAVLDPEGRQVRLSCGAALQHAQVAIRALGCQGEAALLPGPNNPAHLARIQITAGPRGSSAERSLADAILLRRTCRDAFVERRLPAELLATLRVAAEGHGAGLVVLDQPDALIELTVLLAWADRMEEADPDYCAELAAHLRHGASPDGIQTSSLPADPQRGSSLRLRDFSPGGLRHKSDEPPDAEKPDVVVIVTDSDDARSWLQAGQALGAVQLHLASAGVMSQPLAQATDFPAARVRLPCASG